MALDRQPGLMDIGYPVLWIQDRKNGNVGGGFMTSAATWYTRDLNWIGKNTIPGAGIKPNDTTLHTTKGFFGADVGRATPINSPASGNNFQLSKLVLPVGEYYITFLQYSAVSNSVGQLFNITDNKVELSGVTSVGSYSKEMFLESGYIEVTSSVTEFRFEMSGAGGVDFVYGLGRNEYTASQLVAHADIKIYKIG